MPSMLTKSVTGTSTYTGIRYPYVSHKVKSRSVRQLTLCRNARRSCTIPVPPATARNHQDANGSISTGSIHRSDHTNSIRDDQQHFIPVTVVTGSALYLLTPSAASAAATSLAALELSGIGGAFLDFLLHNPFITLGFSAAAVWVVPKLVKGVFRKVLFPAIALLLLFTVVTHPAASFTLVESVVTYVLEHPVLSSITIIVFASLALTPYIMLLLGAVAVFFGASQLAQIQLPALPWQASMTELSQSGFVKYSAAQLQQKAAPLLSGSSSSAPAPITTTVIEPEVLPPEPPTPERLFKGLKDLGSKLAATTQSQVQTLVQSASDTLTPEGIATLQSTATQKLEETQKALEETQKAIKDPEAYNKLRQAARRATQEQLDNLSSTLVQTGEQVIAPVNNDVKMITETGLGVINAAQQSVDTVKNTAIAVTQTVEGVATSVDPSKAAELVQSTVQDVTRVLSPDAVTSTVSTTLETAEKTAKGVVEAVATGKVITKENTEAALQVASKTAADTAQFVKENVLTEENISKAKEVTVEGLKVTKDAAVKTWDFTSRFVVKFGQELKKLSEETAAK